MGLLTSAFQRIIGVKEFADHITLSKGYKCKKMVIPVNTGASNVEVFPPYPANTVGGMLVTFVKTDTGAGQVKVSGLSNLLPWSSTYLGLYQAITLVATPMGWWPHSGVIAPVSREPSLGTLHLLATPVKVLSAGTAVTWTDVDCSAYAPVGARALLFRVQTEVTSSSGSPSYNMTELRKNGSSIGDDLTRAMEIIISPPINGTLYQVCGEATVECDSGRIIEYYNLVNNASAKSTTLILCGYYS